MNVAVLPAACAVFFTTYLKSIRLSAGVQQIRKAEVDLALPCGSNLVMVALDIDPDLTEYRRDRVAYIDQRV